MSYRDQKYYAEKHSISKSKIFLIFITLSTLLLGQFLYLYLGKSIKTNLESNAKNLAIDLDIKEFQTSFPLKFVSKSISAALPPSENLPLNLSVECLNTEGKVNILSLLSLKKNLTVNSKCYGGDLNALLKAGLFNNKFNVNYKASSLILEEYPLLKLFNIKGKVSSSGEIISNEKGEDIKEFSGNIKITEGSFPGGSGFGLPLPLPEITGIEIKCDLEFKNNIEKGIFARDIVLNNCSGDSSLTSVSGKGSARIGDFNQLTLGQAEISLELTEDGVKEIGGYLSLASGEFNENPSKKWDIFLKKAASGHIDSKVIAK